MEPIDFEEANMTLGKPLGFSDEECAPLRVFQEGGQYISCWRPSLKERLSILFRGRVWLGVLGGVNHPPIWIDGTKTVFKLQKAENTSDGD